MAGFLMKSFGGCYGSTVLTAASCWPSSNCVLVQKIVFVSTGFNRNRSALVLDSDNGVYQWFPAGEEFLPREEFHEFRGRISTYS